MKAALHSLDQLNAIAWQQADITGLAGQNGSLQKSDSLDKLKRSLSMPDQITRDIARPLLASALDEVLAQGGVLSAACQLCPPVHCDML